MAFDDVPVAIGNAATGVDDDEGGELGLADSPERAALSGMGATAEEPALQDVAAASLGAQLKHTRLGRAQRRRPGRLSG
jgi:hypothetical protein